MSKRLSLMRLAWMAGLASIPAYWYGARPWHRRWGASDAEVVAAMPGDGLVPDATFSSTRAITIAAPPPAVWPWLVQMGQDRGGLYSYDWLENLAGLNFHSAESIVPEWQSLKVGDTIAVEPGGSGYRVAALEPNRSLVLYVDRESAGAMAPVFEPADVASTWTFCLQPLPGLRTRLVVRWRARYNFASAGDPRITVLGLALEPAEFIMERRMLLGIRERAERASTRHSR